MPEVASQTLELIGRELNASLNEARVALETYVEQPDNLQLIERCAVDLHQVQGVLRVLEIYGAALLAEEMEQVAAYIRSTAKERKTQAESLDALMRAMVQLPSYLERVLSGGRDLALVLLPLLNDLRAVRGSALLSEGTLLLLNLKSDKQPAPVSPGPDEQPLTVEHWARRLRSRFQVGLIGWIRGERIDQNLEILAAVAFKLEQVATRQPVFQLWWVIGGVLEALMQRGLEGGVSVKRLLGLADREIKRLYEETEARYAQQPPVELLNNLLYYIARADSKGPRVASVRASFRLGELLPVDDTVEEERDNLSAPSVKLMRTVAAAIREDLGKLKDVLDMFVRRGGQPRELGTQVELLRKIGDTLGVLGLGDLRSSVQAEIARLDEIVSGARPADHATLVEIAATLIGIEDRLDADLVAMVMPHARVSKEKPSEDTEFRQVQSAVLRECILNLARVKESVAHNVSGTLDASGLDSWPELIRGIQAGLLMLGKTRAVELVERIGQCLRPVMQPGGTTLPQESLDRLADAIVSVEYYMETLQAGRTDPWYMLDNADVCLTAVAQRPVRSVPTVAPLAEDALSQTQRIETTGNAAAAPSDFSATRPESHVPPTLAPKRAVPVALVADPELLELFIEEAGEEVEKIERHYPAWDQNPLEREALVTVRRAFHTLKGSGRMVGARDLAEFAWAIENLLNRLLDNTVSRSPPILATLREAVAALPELTVQLATGRTPTTDIAAIVTRAHALAAGRALGEEPTETSGSMTAPVLVLVPPLEAFATEGEEIVLTGDDFAAATGHSGNTMDAQLREIYSRETGTHILAVRNFIARRRAKRAPHPLDEDVYRACHTLAGSSKMADARHGIRLAVPLDHWLRKVFESGAGLTDSELALLDECMTAMESVALHLDEQTGYFQSHELLRARIARAEIDLDNRVGEENAIPDAARAAAGAEQPPGAEAGSAAPPAPLVLDYDPEIAGIFSEEAVELLDAAENALDAWNEAPADPERLAALKRPLHTLKGGARMAGMLPMGDLSHELETLVNLIESGNVAGNDAVHAVAQAAIDELARMREAVASGRPVAPARELLRRIHALQEEAPLPATPAVAAATAVAVPSAVEAEPEAEAAAEAETATAFGAPPAALVPAAFVAPVAAVVPEPEPEPAARIERELALALEPVGSGSPPPIPAIPSAAQEDALAPPSAVPPGREPVPVTDRPELARVDAELLDQLLNSAGEVSISRARLEQQLGSIDFNLAELSRTVTRLKDQLRNLEIETEKQILNRHEDDNAHRSDFDPLELDRYSSIQQLSRALAETASDVGSIQQLLETLTEDTQNLLQQQARTVTELQNGLMRTRMVPFQRHVQRLARIVRQAAADTGKRADLVVEGASGELDRQVLERMLPPFEHLLRNAIVHGIETPETRRARGKSETGQITLTLKREGSEVIVQMSDDGAGMDLAAIREKAIQLGMVPETQALTDEGAMQLILEPGFSTASSLTHTAGRGVGMDVVATEVKKLGGALHMETRAGEGSSFTIRLPFTLAISHALVVRTAEEFYALPLPTVEGVVRLSKSEVAGLLRPDAPPFEYAGQKYRFANLASFVGLEPSPLPEQDVTIPVVMVRAGEHSTGLVTDELVGSREIVVKPVGPQISAIRGISGATILGDGRIVVILDIGALVRMDSRSRIELPLRDRADKRTFAMVVDDSITVRRVTQRLLERNGMRVLTARDGLDAVTLLQEHTPDIILLDIEMPRMDGYEVAAQVRSDPRLADTPIIMITSRVGEKHRARAIELGVDDYLGKPYQEAQLLEAIEPLVARRRDRSVRAIRYQAAQPP
jgi:chemosensory pili system protein ChpA (sensor histidine kinase/response regulator)